MNFLPRRTYENYLIDDEAISQLLTAEAGQPVPVEKIRDWISAHKEDRAYLDNPLAEGVDWAHVVDAPKLLYDLFNAMTDAKVEYRKTHHSVELTKWLLAKKPSSLKELFDYLKELISPH